MKTNNANTWALKLGPVFIVVFGWLGWGAVPTTLAADHSGTIAVNETWLAVDNPHNITANVTVNAGVTLTIGPGVEVYAAYNTRINVYGVLTVNGMAGNEVEFSRSGASAWYGLRFLTAGAGTASHAVIQGASYGVDIGSTGLFSANNVTFQNNSFAVYATNGAVQLASSTFKDNTNYGFWGSGVAPTFTDSNSLFENNHVSLSVSGVSGLNFSTPVTIRNNDAIGLHLDDCDNATINNLTFTGNTGVGGALAMDDTGEFTLGAGNSFGGTGLENSWAVTLGSGAYASAGSTLPTSGNTNNDIQIWGGASARSGTWRHFPGLDYILNANMTISAGGQLTIADNSTLRFNNSIRINVYGTLIADGTSGGGIYMTQSTGSRWYGLRFLGSADGHLEYCHLEQANTGIDMSSSGTVTLENIEINDGLTGIYHSDGVLDLTHITLYNHSTQGIYAYGAMPAFLDANTTIDNCGIGLQVRNVDGLSLTTAVALTNNVVGLQITDSNEPTVNNLTITGSTGPLGAIFMDDTGEFELGSGNTIGGVGMENTWPVTIASGAYPDLVSVIPTTGNTNNDIQVNGGSSVRSGTWHAFSGLDYIVTATPAVSATGQLTLADNLTVRFNNNLRINVYGTLTAVGTSGGGITLTPNTGSNWYGLRFLGAGQGDLAYCTLDHVASGIAMESTGTVTVANTEIHDGTTAVYQSNGQLELASLTIQDMNTYGVYSYTAVPSFTDGNTTIDNCGTGIFLQNVAGINLNTPITLTGNTLGLQCLNCDNPTVDNLVITGSTGLNGAIFMDDTGDFHLGGGNTIGGSGLENSWPLTLAAGAFPSVTSMIPTTGNTNNDIQVRSGSSDRTGTWPKFVDLDYIVTATVGINTGGELIIADTVDVLFGPNVRFNVYGVLTAIGTPGGGIHFTSNSASLWFGLRFLTAGSGELDYCTIDQASYGVYTSSSGTITVANTSISDGSTGVYQGDGSVELTSVAINNMGNEGINAAGFMPTFMDANTTIDNCDRGIYVNAMAGLNLDSVVTLTNNDVGVHCVTGDNPSLNNLSITGSTGSTGAIYMDDTGEFHLGPDNIIGGPGQENSWPLSLAAGAYASATSTIPQVGNTNNDIQVTGGSSTRTFVWRDFPGLDYLVGSTFTISAGGELVLDEGVTLRMGNNVRITTYGTLTIQGTQSNRVHLTSNGGYLWNGLRFLADGAGSLTHAIIDHAAYGLHPSGTGTISVTACDLLENTYGLYGDSGIVEFLNCRIFNNTNYGIYLFDAIPVFGNNLSQWNDIYDNGDGELGHDFHNDVTDIEANYVYWGVTHWHDIQEVIWDKLDDLQLGLVDYEPWCNDAHNQAITGVPEDQINDLPKRFACYQNYPNPFNATTLISFDLDRPTSVKLSVYDVSGAHVATLINDLLPATTHTVSWHGHDDRGRRVSSGVYFYRLKTDNHLETRQMVLVQ